MINYNESKMKLLLKFASERQKIFYRRIAGQSYPWTTNQILLQHKFTNVYRVSDRISQYLISEVINNPLLSQNIRDLSFRIILFKIFNREEPWEYLRDRIGDLTLESFENNWQFYAKLLDNCDKLFSPAYMMTGNKLAWDRKHWNYLFILHEMVKNNSLVDILDHNNLKKTFDYLGSFQNIGNFLAYQYTIDLNYSNVLNCDENSYVFAGPGTIRGIMRLYDISQKDAEEKSENIIKGFIDYQDDIQEHHGIFIPDLFGRKLHIPDFCNVLCEFDKYCREALPEDDLHGKKRIKQNYSLNNKSKINYMFPTKWEIRASKEKAISYIE